VVTHVRVVQTDTAYGTLDSVIELAFPRKGTGQDVQLLCGYTVDI
jgi:hypothetical protein